MTAQTRAMCDRMRTQAAAQRSGERQQEQLLAQRPREQQVQLLAQRPRKQQAQLLAQLLVQQPLRLQRGPSLPLGAPVGDELLPRLCAAHLG